MSAVITASASAMNRLSEEKSSYLRTAAHQPVHWMAWGADAFRAAREADKPILLDIGAVWCHWCHVMDRESYEDAALAEIINRSFIAVKVDRDERPDVDTRYQKSIQAMTGQGGWPLTGFLLPDGRCFYGGTYFPPRDAHGRPSFRRVLESVADAYAKRKDELLANADALTQHMTQRAGNAGKGAEGSHAHDFGDLDALLTHAVGHMQEAFDPEHGGFGRAPKFPHPAAHDLLLARGLAGDKTALDLAVATLEAMRAGGIYDQLAGGFHRYSVDAEWVVPHFEKMLYDNAGLLRNYARAGSALGRADLRETADEIVAFLRDVLAHADGGFGGSQDADMDLEDDGDFFTWSLAELHAAVPDAELARLMCARYMIRAQGDMPHDRSRCVLRVAADSEALAAAFHHPVAELNRRLAEGKRLMQGARGRRKAPFVDPTRYTNWNAMAIQALLEHGGAFDNAASDALALRALDLFLAECWQRESGFSRAVGSATRGFLDDNAQMLEALLEAHFATGDERYLDAARATADVLLRHFRHPDGGFADRAAALAPASEARTLDVPDRPVQDAPTASPNGVALAALLRLAEATGHEAYARAAEEGLDALAQEAVHNSLFGGAILLAIERRAHPAPRIVVPRGDASAFRATARRAAPPGATFAGADADLPPEARAYRGEGALVCIRERCLAPANDARELETRLRSLRR